MRLISSSRAFILALAVGSLISAAPPFASAVQAGPSVNVDVGLFYDNLAVHGQWVQDASYGWIWAPQVASGWRPYTLGHWVWTDEYGWLWVSDEDFGWATYHYGRWFYQPVYGWAWVPGYEWGPSWVSFRTGGGYIGWAPLPPNVGWQAGFGFNVGGVSFDSYIQPNYYTFVPQQAFVDHAIPRYAVPASRNTQIINETKNVTNYTVAQNRVVNRSLKVDDVEKVVKKPVPRLRTVDVDSVRSAHNAKVKGNEVPVFRPAVREAKAKVPPHGKPLASQEGGRATPPQANSRDERNEASQRTREQAAEQHEAQQRQATEAKQQADARRAAEAKQQADAKRAVEAKQQADAKRAADAKREADARQKLEQQRQDQERQAQKQREDVARQQQQQEREKAAARQREEDARQRADMEKRQALERSQREREQREMKTPARSDVDRTRERDQGAVEHHDTREQPPPQVREDHPEQPAPAKKSTTKKSKKKAPAPPKPTDEPNHTP